MKITIDELFSDIEFENLIKDNWKQQYQKYKKLPAVTKKAVVNELLKHYETVEYIKGSRSHKPCFEIGGRRDVELTQADMVEKGYYKPGSSNISNHNIIALNIFKNYLNQLILKEVETISMTNTTTTTATQEELAMKVMIAELKIMNIQLDLLEQEIDEKLAK